MNDLIPRHHRTAIYLLAFISFFLYLNGFSDKLFIWDDHHLIRESPYARDLRHAIDLLKPAYWKELHPIRQPGAYRPIRQISFALDHTLWQGLVTGFYVTNALVNALNTVLFYLLLVLLFRNRSLPNETPRETGEDDNLALPFLAALLFAVHPVHTESVVWIKNRSNLLAFLFLVPAVVLFCRYHYRRKASWFLCALIPGTICYALALGSNEIAFVLPVFLALWFLFDSRGAAGKTLLVLLPGFVVMGLYLYLKFRVLTIHDPLSGLEETFFDAAPEIDPIPHILLVFTTLFEYIRVLAFPLELKVERMLDPPTTLTFQAIGGMAIFLLSILLLYRFRRNKPLVFGLAWLWITLLPVSNIVYLWSRPLAEQRLYVPSAGFCLILAFCFQGLHSRFTRIPAAQRAVGLVVLAVALSFSVRTVVRNHEWTRGVAFWEKAAAQSPESPRVWRGLAAAYAETEDDDQVKQALLRAIELDPGFTLAYGDLARHHQKQDDMEAAVRTFETLVSLRPEDDEVHRAMGEFLYDNKRYDAAAVSFRQSLRYNDHRNDKSHFYLGTILARKGNFAPARYHLERSIAANPYNASAHNDLGNVYNYLNAPEQAVRRYRRAIEIDPGFFRAYLNLGNTYIHADDPENALNALRGAMAIDPRDAELNNSIGIAHLLGGRVEAAINHFHTAIARNPEFAEAYNNLAVVYAERKQYRLAVRFLEKAEELGWRVKPGFVREMAPHRGASKEPERIAD